MSTIAGHSIHVHGYVGTWVCGYVGMWVWGTWVRGYVGTIQRIIIHVRLTHTNV